MDEVLVFLLLVFGLLASVEGKSIRGHQRSYKVHPEPQDYEETESIPPINHGDFGKIGVTESGASKRPAEEKGRFENGNFAWFNSDQAGSGRKALSSLRNEENLTRRPKNHKIRVLGHDKEGQRIKEKPKDEGISEVFTVIENVPRKGYDRQRERFAAKPQKDDGGFFEKHRDDETRHKTNVILVGPTAIQQDHESSQYGNHKTVSNHKINEFNYLPSKGRIKAAIHSKTSEKSERKNNFKMENKANRSRERHKYKLVESASIPFNPRPQFHYYAYCMQEPDDRVEPFDRRPKNFATVPDNAYHHSDIFNNVRYIINLEKIGPEGNLSVGRQRAKGSNPSEMDQVPQEAYYTIKENDPGKGSARKKVLTDPNVGEDISATNAAHSPWHQANIEATRVENNREDYEKDLARIRNAWKAQEEAKRVSDGSRKPEIDPPLITQPADSIHFEVNPFIDVDETGQKYFDHEKALAGSTSFDIEHALDDSRDASGFATSFTKIRTTGNGAETFAPKPTFPFLPDLPTTPNLNLPGDATRFDSDPSASTKLTGSTVSDLDLHRIQDRLKPKIISTGNGFHSTAPKNGENFRETKIVHGSDNYSSKFVEGEKFGRKKFVIPQTRFRSVTKLENHLPGNPESG